MRLITVRNNENIDGGFLMTKNKTAIELGSTVLGIEFGSTRIKSVLLNGDNNEIIASGSHSWENDYVDGVWTYSLDAIWNGLQSSYKNLVQNIKKEYGLELKKIGVIGFSAMMHGYLPFNKEGELLVPFRTWRNNFTEDASKKLTETFAHPIPQRWSVAHLYHAVTNEEEHVSDIDFMTTLEGFIHWKLSGEKVIGIGEASGMFPVDLKTKDFNKEMMEKFTELVADYNLPWKIEKILPEPLVAGEEAGRLTETGAKLLDPSGILEAGSLMCPPEGDAGTGMVATNSIAERTGNVSAGTSVFAMVVLEDELSKPHPELDLVMTPTGKLVAMAHSNNCSSNLDKWINIFQEAVESLGFKVDKNTLYETLYNKGLEGDKDCGGLLAYGYLSGEHITGFEEGRPLFTMESDSNFNLANFMRVNLQSALGAMKLGMDILIKEENVKLDKMLGHGGLFKTEGVAQNFMSAAVDAPVSVMETAGEGGAWGIALLASYHLNKKEGQTLEKYLNQNIFADQNEKVIEPDPADVKGFEKFMQRYKAGLSIERAAVENLN
jgi:sugar (pentulose or hexulose) kinase